MKTQHFVRVPLVLKFLKLLAIVLVLQQNSVRSATADEPTAKPTLKNYKSNEGQFSVLLPSEPKFSVVTLPDSEDKQWQIITGGKDGVYMISWQESPFLSRSEEKKQMEALKSARDVMMKQMGGELIKEQQTTIGKKHAALQFRMNIQEGKGEMLGIYFFAKDHLFQIMVIGTKDFVYSQQSKEVVDSFQLAKDRPR